MAAGLYRLVRDSPSAVHQIDGAPSQITNRLLLYKDTCTVHDTIPAAVLSCYVGKMTSCYEKLIRNESSVNTFDVFVRHPL